MNDSDKKPWEPEFGPEPIETPVVKIEVFSLFKWLQKILSKKEITRNDNDH